MSRLKRQRLDRNGNAQVTSSDDSETRPLQDAVTLHGPNNNSTHPSSRSLFVRSLPPSVTSESLTDFFSNSYPVKHATVVVDKATKQSRGFGFVTLADAEDARIAQERFDGIALDGQHLSVILARPRARKNGTVSTSNPVLPPKEPPSAHSQAGRKLIVRNLPWNVKRQDQIKLLFQKYGKVQFIDLPKTKPGLSPGFGFVTFQSSGSAAKALSAMNDIEVEGRTLAVDWAVEKHTWEALQLSVNASRPEGSGQSDSEKDDARADVVAEEGLEGAGTQHDVSTASQPCPGDLNEQTQSRHASQEGYTSTLFINNVPFTTTDSSLFEHFATFGPLQTAKVVKDASTGAPKGTAFVRFKSAEDARRCFREASALQTQAVRNSLRKESLLEDSAIDPTGRFTLEGRNLKICWAVDRAEAARLAKRKADFQRAQQDSNRRLYLVAEGTIPSGSSLHAQLTPTELKLREDGAKQRKALLDRDPSLALSLTRLSIRNLPKDHTSKVLKKLAREAVVGFARDVKNGLRKALSQEESIRGGQDMRVAEKRRKAQGKGIVKQAKVIFEARDGAKVAEGDGAGRSRGYGFIEYTSHRWALMGLRWLNGHLVEPLRREPSSASKSQLPVASKRRLIVEFAIDNAQVIARRQLREDTGSRIMSVKPDTNNFNNQTTNAKNKASDRRIFAEHEGEQISVPQSSTSVDTRKPERSSKIGDVNIQRMIGRKRKARKVKGRG